jgi:hypothetical protein
MTSEELQQALRELEERIEGLEIDLTPPEESESNFTVFENETGDRQMIVHFVDVSAYSLENPKDRKEAHTVFLKVIKEHKDHQDKEISHGDLMVINANPCNYYGYVAKVDKVQGLGFQSEDKLKPPAALSNEVENGVLHEIVIWTEVYPGSSDGSDDLLQATVLTVTTGSETTSALTKFNLTYKANTSNKTFTIFDAVWNPGTEKVTTVDVTGVASGGSEPGTPLKLDDKYTGIENDKLINEAEFCTTCVSVATDLSGEGKYPSNNGNPINFCASHTVITPETPGDPKPIYSNTLDITREGYDADGNPLGDPTPIKMFDATWVGSADPDDTTKDTFYFGAPTKKDPPPGDPIDITSVNSLNVSVDFEPTGTNYEHFLSAEGNCVGMTVTEEPTNSSEDPVLLLGLTPSRRDGDKIVVTPPPDSGLSSFVPDDRELPIPDFKPLKDCVQITTNDGSPTPVEGYPVDIISEFTESNFTVTPGTPTGGAIQVDLKEYGSAPEPDTASIVELKPVSGSCLLEIVQKGEITVTKKPYTGTRHTLQNTTNTVKLELKAKKLELSKKLQKTLLKRTNHYYETGYGGTEYEIELDASILEYKNNENKVDVEIDNIVEKKYWEHTGDLTVSINASTDNYSGETTLFGFTDKKAEIEWQKGEYTGKEYTATITRERYKVAQTTRQDSITPKVVTFSRPDSKCIKVTPGIAKIVLADKFLHSNEERSYEWVSKTLGEHILTPLAQKIYVSDRYKLEITDNPAYLDFKSAQSLNLISDAWDWENFVVTLKAKQKEVKLQTKDFKLTSSECKTAGVSIGGTTEDLINLLDATLEESSTPKTGVLSSMYPTYGTQNTINEQFHPVRTKPIYEAAQGTITIPAVSIHTVTPKYPYPEDRDTRFYSDVVTQRNGEDSGFTFDFNKIEITSYTEADSDVDVHSLEYTPGISQPVPGGDKYIDSTIFDVPAPVDKGIRVDKFKVTVTDDDSGSNDYDDISTTTYTKDSQSQAVEGRGSTSLTDLEYISKAGCDVKGNFKKSSPTLGVSSGYELKGGLKIPVIVTDKGESTEDIENTGPDQTIIDVTGQGSSATTVLSETDTFNALVSTGSGDEINGEDVEISIDNSGAGTSKFVPTVDGEYKPTSDSIKVINESGSADLDCVKNTATGDLTFTLTIPTKEHKVSCGILGPADDSDGIAVSFVMNTQALYTEQLTVCTDSGSAPTPLNVLVTNGTGTAAGFMITGCS